MDSTGKPGTVDGPIAVVELVVVPLVAVAVVLGIMVEGDFFKTSPYFEASPARAAV